jgi:hypothetical protein
MRMNVKLFTLQMSPFKAEEQRGNSVAKWNSKYLIPKFTEDELGRKYLSSNKIAAKQADP